ncbi:MAG: LAGLIDADG family homing endonuclease [Candidatus Aenigmarchaeota archaeon]|nr:LAGLIDADG family homing endonuclease [Candidatus Aenigmarchaeota archaeon]
MEEREKLKLRKLLKELEKIKGRHTELVSVYVPAGFNLVEIINQLTQEKSTAQNIKSKTTRKNVLDALEKIISHLKLFKQTPANGLIVFCGNVSEVEGKTDIRLWSLEPPERMSTKMYWCDQVFVLEPLEEMIKEKEVYGLVVLDTREANIGLLKGKAIEPLKHLVSTVPSKTVKGGMCLHEESLLQLKNGAICPVKFLDKNNKVLTFSFSNFKQTFTNPHEIFKRKVRRAYEIITKEPTFRLIASPEHKIFVLTENGIIEKFVEDLEVGDRLLALKKSDIKCNLSSLSKEMCQILGYLLGDGTLDGNRIIAYEKDFQLASFYSKLIEKNLRKKPRILKKKNTYEIRVYDIKVVRFVLQNFQGLLGTRKDRKIPINLTKLSGKWLCYFLRGLFDAEGYISQGKICIRLSNENIICTLQLLLLKLGIVSSISEADKFGRYNLQITNPFYTREFWKKINFSSKNKKLRLRKFVAERNYIFHVDKVPILGSLVRKKIESINLNKQYFTKVSNFFTDTRNMSYPVFYKRIILPLIKRINSLKKNGSNIKYLRKLLRLRQKDVTQAVGASVYTIWKLERKNIKNELREEVLKFLLERKRKLTKDSETVLRELLKILNSQLIQVVVKERRKIKPTGIFYDLYIPDYYSFFINGILVHNSQKRYDRIREDAIHEFLTKVGEIASKLFLEQKELKWVIIGGPGYIKELLLKEDYLHYQIKNKVLGLKDTSYTGEYGLEELVGRAQDLLKEASIAKEKGLLGNFLREIQIGGKVSYKIDDVVNALNAGAVDTLLISDALDVVEVRLACKCGEKKMKVGMSLAYEQICERCGEKMAVKEIKELVDEFIETAKKFGTRIEFVSTDTREGVQFKELGGIGAFLRYKLS